MEYLILLVLIPLLVFAAWVIVTPEAMVVTLFVASMMSSVSFEIGPAVVRVDALIAPVLIMASIFYRHRTGGVKRDSWRTVFALALATLVASATLASASVSPEPVRSYFMLLNFALGALVFFALVPLDMNWQRVVKVCTWALTCVSALSIAELLLSPGATQLTAPPQGGDGYRVRGLALEPNLMATLCAGWLGVMFYWRSAMERLYLLPVAVITVAAVFTNTRAAWISILVTSGFTLWTLRARLLVVIPAAAAMSALTAILLAPGLANADRGSFGWKLTNLLAGDTGTGLYRIRTWDIALGDLSSLEAYSTGLGVNSYSQRHPVDLTGATEGYLSSVWIGWLYDGGVVGVALFGILLLAAFLYAYNRVEAVPSFAAVLISASFTNPLWMTFPWLILALSVVPVGWRAPQGTADDRLRNPSRSRSYAS